MRWKIVLEGTDEFGSAHRSELTINKDLERVSAGEIGFSVEDGKIIMAHLQQVVVSQQCDAYVLASRFCADCEGFRRIKDYSRRKIRTVFGCVEVRNPRILNCQRCLPHFCAAWTILRDICPDQATPESRPGRYFTTADTSKRELQSRTLQALQSEGYAGRGEVTVLSDGAEIMKRLPKALPQPTAHIIHRHEDPTAAAGRGSCREVA